MSVWTGRVLGLIIGFFILGPIGAAIGFALGYYYNDKPKMIALRNDANARASFTYNANYNRELISSTFALMGYVARGAGRINEEQINKASQIMNLMNLDDISRNMAIESFNRGKDSSFDVDSELMSLKGLIRDNPTVISYLLEIQVQIALADGSLEELEHHRLIEIATKLGIAREAMERLIRMRVVEMEFNRRFSNGGFSQGSYGYAGQGNSDSGYRGSGNSDNLSDINSGKLKDAYEILGVKAEDSWEDIKKAHKRLMFKYHPDRLASQGLPKEMINMYTEKAKDIQAAFDLIRKEREQ